MFSSIVSSIAEVDGLILVMSGADLGGIVWSSTETKNLRKNISKQCISREMLRQIWYPIDPKNFSGLIRPDRKNIMSVRTEFDSIIQPKFQQILENVISPSNIFSLPSSHYGTILYKKRISNLILEFMVERFGRQQ
jgi:hypothetical protein